MFFQYGRNESKKQSEESQQWASELESYLAPYTERLDAYLDRRVVGNLVATIASIVGSRTDLTLTELGSGICGAAHTDAGVQRVHRLLHHQGWQAVLLEEVLWEQAEQKRHALEAQGETVLCVWDSSVLEKSESEKLEGLGRVRSSRVRRLARSRKGAFNRPAGIPVGVPGFEWESLVLVSQSGGPPQVAAMR